MSIPAVNIFSDYFPQKTEVDATVVRDKRGPVAAWLRSAFTSQDTAVGTVFGDMYVTPLAFTSAAVDIAVNRLLGDLSLDNISNGGAYYCPVAAGFVGNFTSTPSGSLPRGFVTLTFSADADVTLPSDIRFMINGVEFYPDVSFAGAVAIKKVGTSFDPNTNSFILSRVSAEAFVVSIPVEGSSEVSVVAGDQVTVVRYQIDNLTSVEVDFDFVSAIAHPLSHRAKQAQLTYVTSNGSSQAGITATVLRAHPDLTSVSVIMPWDAAMLRVTEGLMGGAASADVFVRSKHYGAIVTQDVVFKKGSGDFLIAEFVPRFPAISVVSCVSVNEDLWTPDGDECSIYIQTTDESTAPAITCAGTEFQRLFIELQLSNAPDLSADTTIDNVPGYTITVSYRVEPVVTSIQRFLWTDDNRPLNVNLLVRPFIPIMVGSVTVKYTTKTGTKVLVDQAIGELQQYLTQCGGDAPVSFAKVCEIMTYANANDVVDVNVVARAWFSPATHLIPATEPDPITDYAAAVAQAITIPVWQASTLRQLSPSNDYSDPDIGTASETYASLTRRNVALIVEPSAIELVEV